MKSVYLIDYENVNERGIDGIDRLTSDDVVYILYTPMVLKIGLECLSNVSASLRTIKVAPGNQSLDNHLISWLGYLLGSETDPDTQYIIVSNDAGYERVMKFWCSRYGNVQKVVRRGRIGNKNVAQTFTPDDEIHADREQLEEDIREIMLQFGEVDSKGRCRMEMNTFCSKLNALDEYNRLRKVTGKKALKFIMEDLAGIVELTKDNKRSFAVLSGVQMAVEEEQKDTANETKETVPSQVKPAQQTSKPSSVKADAHPEQKHESAPVQGTKNPQPEEKTGEQVDQKPQEIQSHPAPNAAEHPEPVQSEPVQHPPKKQKNRRNEEKPIKSPKKAPKPKERRLDTMDDFDPDDWFISGAFVNDSEESPISDINLPEQDEPVHDDNVDPENYLPAGWDSEDQHSDEQQPEEGTDVLPEAVIQENTPAVVKQDEESEGKPEPDKETVSPQDESQASQSEQSSTDEPQKPGQKENTVLETSEPAPKGKKKPKKSKKPASRNQKSGEEQPTAEPVSEDTAASASGQEEPIATAETTGEAAASEEIPETADHEKEQLENSEVQGPGNDIEAGHLSSDVEEQASPESRTSQDMPQGNLEETILQMLGNAGLSDEESRGILPLITESKDAFNPKLVLYNAMRKQFGGNEGRRLYQKIKDIL